MTVYSGNIKVKEELTIDLSHDKIEPGTKFDCIDIENEGLRPAIFLTHSKKDNTSLYSQNLDSLDKVTFEGDRNNSSGIYLENCSFMQFNNCNISGFHKGLIFGKNTWSTVFTNVSIYRCSRAISWDYGAQNSGANVSFFGSHLFNSDYLLDIKEKFADFFFYGCSFDAPGKAFFNIDMGSCTLVGCHVEGNFKPIIVNEGTFHMKGGTISLHDVNYYEDKTLFKQYGGRIILDHVGTVEIPCKFLINGYGNSEVTLVDQHGKLLPTYERKSTISWLTQRIKKV